MTHCPAASTGTRSRCGAVGAGAGLALGILSSLMGCAVEDQPAEQAGPPNLMVISFDTMRADAVGAYGNPDAFTPNLDQFAGESILFEDTYSQSCETLFSHGSLFSSRYPSELGLLDYSFILPEKVPVLAEVLGLYGYRSGAFVGGGHLSTEYEFDRGFERFEAPEGFGSFFHTAPLALDWLDRSDGDQPFFLFLHGYDSHHRYYKPPPYGLAFVDTLYKGLGLRVAKTITGTLLIKDGYYMPNHSPGRTLDLSALRLREPAQRRLELSANRAGRTRMVKFGKRDQDYIRGLYKGAVAYADAWFGLVMADLEERGLLENTVIVVLSDHGEELGEDGLFDHRFGMSDEILHVPLMIRMPGGEGGGRRVQGLTALLDVMPTLLELGGAVVPAEAQGRSLVSTLEGGEWSPRDAVFSEGAYRMVSARTAQGRLSFWGLSADSPFLADVLEVSPLNGPAFEVSDGLGWDARVEAHQHMLGWRKGLTLAESAGTRLSEVQRAALQRHGYWDRR